MPTGSGRTKNLRFGATDEPTGWQKASYDEAQKRIQKWNLERNQAKKRKKQMNKGQGYEGMDMTMQALFDDAKDISTPAGLSVDDMEDVYEVDIDLISQDANTLAASNVQNLLRLYNNKEFTDEHPDFKRRIDTEIESLRKLYKMARVNEEVHDHLVTSITRNPGNASLYMALDRMQGKILAVDKQIRDQISNFNKIITSYQMELNFQNDNDLNGGDNTSSELDDGSVMSRGSKAFIEDMKSKQATSEQKPEIDVDNLPTGWKVDEETGEIYDEDTGEVMGNIHDQSSN